jgi:hypothetical protein
MKFTMATAASPSGYEGRTLRYLDVESRPNKPMHPTRISAALKLNHACGWVIGGVRRLCFSKIGVECGVLSKSFLTFGGHHARLLKLLQPH